MEIMILSPGIKIAHNYVWSKILGVNDYSLRLTANIPVDEPPDIDKDVERVKTAKRSFIYAPSKECLA